MGNSGSMHNIDIDSFADYSHHNFYRNHHQQDNQQNDKTKYHHAIKWTQSYPLETGGQTSTLLRPSQSSSSSSTPPLLLPPHHQSSHFKVLPDLKEGPLLRNTTNGAILHSGGTISGRKQNFSHISPQPIRRSSPPPPPVLQRSRTSIEYDLSALRLNSNKNYDGGSNSSIISTDEHRSSPSLMVINGARHYNYNHSGGYHPQQYRPSSGQHATTSLQRNFQKNPLSISLRRDRSSNDLQYHNFNNADNKGGNFSHQLQQLPINDSNSPRSPQKTTSKAEKIKNKKRKAPDPPTKSNHSLLLGNSKKNTSANSRLQAGIPDDKNPSRDSHEKKNRLFKTKAESKKVSSHQESNKIELPVDKLDLHYKNKGPSRTDTPPNSSISNHKLQEKSNLKDAKYIDRPLFPFRREKSFDITLLRHNSSRNQIKPTLAPNNTHDKTLDDYKQRRLQPVGSVNDLTNLVVNTTITQSTHHYRHPQEYSKQSPLAVEKSQLPTTSERISSSHMVIDKKALQSSLSSSSNERKFSQPNVVENINNSDFKKELQEVTKRRSIALECMEKRKELQQKHQIKRDNSNTISTNLEKSSKSPSLPHQKKLVDKHSENSTSIDKKNARKHDSKIPKLMKTFYFGMESKISQTDDEINNHINEVKKRKTPERLSTPTRREKQHLKSSASSETTTLSDNDNDDDDDAVEDNNSGEINRHYRKNIENPEPYRINAEEAKSNEMNYEINSGDNSDIQIHVRPTLPRRQLEVPQFSPAAAWRMLSDEQQLQLRAQAISNGNNKFIGLNSLLDTKLLVQMQQKPIQEEKIHRIYREPMPLYVDNKSRDSGISGDGVVQPEQINDSPNNGNGGNLQSKIEPFLIPWTPQQDLEGESSSDGEINGHHRMNINNCNGIERNNYRDKDNGVYDDDDDEEEENGDDDEDDDYDDEDDRNENSFLHKYPNYSHLFSLSLPRESHLSSAAAAYALDYTNHSSGEEKQGYSSLLKLKRRLSEALTNIGTAPPDRMTNYCNNDNNWLLSRSKTNSIDNGFRGQLQQDDDNTSQNGSATTTNNNELLNDTVNGQEQQQQQQQNQRSPSMIQPLSLSYLIGGGKHVMYLPTESSTHQYQNDQNCFTNVYKTKNKLKNSDPNPRLSPSQLADKNHLEYDREKHDSNSSNRKHLLAKDIDWNTKKCGRKITNNSNSNGKSGKERRESLQDPPSVDSYESKLSTEKSNFGKNRNSGGHRFAFQSAIRQIERRRIAEKLSKEAEQKEACRLSEIEAMKRVEEDFQRKRAKEKASIRQQWRMFSLDENRCSSLPTDFQINNNNENIIDNNYHHSQQNQRSEPEGAVSGATTPSIVSNENNNIIRNEKIESKILIETTTNDNNNKIMNLIDTNASKLLSKSMRRQIIDTNKDCLMDEHGDDYSYAVDDNDFVEKNQNSMKKNKILSEFRTSTIQREEYLDLHLNN